MAKKPTGLEQLLVEELQDLFDAEKQLVKALPKMAKSASDEELENALREHLEVTKGQVDRLTQVFQSMELAPRGRTCVGMKGIVAEGQVILGEKLEEGVLDCGIIGASRRMEHYEMAGYESARMLAQQLGMREAAGLLEQNLQEEIQTDKHLAQIGKRLAKEVSSQRGQEQPEQERARRVSGNGRGREKAAAHRRAAGNGRQRRVAVGGQTRSEGSHAARPLTEHHEIRQWAEERGAKPSHVRGTGGGEDIGMIRLDFPGYTGEESLEEISWDEWFDKFDRSDLALIVQDTTAGGERSNFNKIVSRESVAEKVKPKTRSAH